MVESAVVQHRGLPLHIEEAAQPAHGLLGAAGQVLVANLVAVERRTGLVHRRHEFQSSSYRVDSTAIRPGTAQGVGDLRRVTQEEHVAGIGPARGDPSPGQHAARRLVDHPVLTAAFQFVVQEAVPEQMFELTDRQAERVQRDTRVALGDVVGGPLEFLDGQQIQVQFVRGVNA